MRCRLHGAHLLDLFVGEHVFLVMREGVEPHSMPCWIRAGTDVDGESVQVIETTTPGNAGIYLVSDYYEVVPTRLRFVDPDDVEYVLHGNEPGVLSLYRALRVALATSAAA